MFLIVPLVTLPHFVFPFYTHLGFDLKGLYYHAKQNKDLKDNEGYLREAFVSQIMDKVVSEIQKQDMILKEYSDASVCNDNIEFSLITMVFIISCDEENSRAIWNSNFSVARTQPHFNNLHHFEWEQ